MALASAATSGIHVVRADSLAALVTMLAADLSGTRTDPFATDIIVTPSGGVQRWIQQQLAQQLGAGSNGDGICAGIDFLSLSHLLERTQQAVLPELENLWDPAQLTWHILAEIDVLPDTSWSHFLTAYLAKNAKATLPGQRLAAAKRIAAIWHNYAQECPSLLSRWSAENDVDHNGAALCEPDQWQPHLWRAVRARIGTLDLVQQQQTLQDLYKSAPVPGLPTVLTFIAPKRVSRSQQELISAISNHHRINVFLVDHCPAIAANTIPQQENNRLQHRLGQAAVIERNSWLELADTDTVLPPQERAATRLGLVQKAVATDANFVDFPAVFDSSFSLHVSHDPARQIEVLRDELTRLLENDHTLEPRDIVVLCPQLATIAPLLQSAFEPLSPDLIGETSPHPGRSLRVRIADRSIGQPNPLLQLLSDLLDLISTRIDVTAVMDFIASDPVVSRFGFDDEALSRLEELIRRSGVRWGLDGSHRAHYGAIAAGYNTWQAGLDRMLAGVALSEDTLLPLGSTALPLDDVGSGDVVLVGRLAEIIEHISLLEKVARSVHTIHEWVKLFKDSLQGLTEVPISEAWQYNHAFSELNNLIDQAPVDSPKLSLGDVRILLTEAMSGIPPRAGFGTGSLIICSPDQLRHISHRVVVLLGFDSSVFPSSPRINGDNLLSRTPQIEDFDPRSYDRQLLLDAVMSAKDAVIIFGEGSTENNDKDLKLSSPIAELVSYIKAEKAVWNWHTLHAWSPQSFAGDLPSFDAGAAKGAYALRQPQQAIATRWPRIRLTPIERSERIDLEDLIRTIQHPVKEHVRLRMGLRIVDNDIDNLQDQIPVDPDGLQRWNIGNRVLQLVKSGVEFDTALSAEWLRGELPPAERGKIVLAEVSQQVKSILDTAPPLTDPEHHIIDIAVGDRRICGSVVTHGNSIVDISYSKPSVRHLLRGWMQLLALQQSKPGIPWTWRMIGKNQSQDIPTIPSSWLLPLLQNLIEFTDMATVEPLPFLPTLSERYFNLRRDNLSEDELWQRMNTRGYAGVLSWDSDTDTVFRNYFPTLSDLRTTSPQLSDSARYSESSRFGTLSRRIFEPLFQHKEANR
ncbi:MAG: exodeoxyribonuclease V subunit gamma [Propionibacteriaceae bacterium]